MATTFKAYYDGAAFVPMIPIDLQIGKVFDMSILPDSPSVSCHNVGQITAFKQITDNLNKIKTEPLSGEFDKILSQGVHFKNVNL